MAKHSVIIHARNEPARARLQKALMEAGGTHGVGWRFKRVYDGGIFIADYPDEDRDDITFALLDWMQRRERPYLRMGADWMMSPWRQDFTDEQMDAFNDWRAERHEALTGEKVERVKG